MSLISGFLGIFGGRAALFLIIPLLFFAGLSTYRGGKIDRLNEKVGAMSAALDEAEAENKRLARSLSLINAAAQAQAVLNDLATRRRDKIDGLALYESTVARPEGVIDEEKSREVIELFNADIFTPLGRGLHEGRTAPVPDSLPGPGAANNAEPEPG